MREANNQNESEVIAYSIKRAVAAANGATSRAGIYRAAERGELTIRKKGRRSYLLASDFKRWLECDAGQKVAA